MRPNQPIHGKPWSRVTNLDGPFDGDGADLETYYQKLLVYDFCPGQA